VHPEAHPAARAVLDLVLARPATLGEGRLLRIDGPSGSGKTTLARAVARLAAAEGVRRKVVHLDELYDGWDGLPRVGDQLATLLRPLADGHPGCYGHYDWHAGRYTRTVTVEPVPLLVLEGVGSGLAAHDDVSTVLVWVTAPADVRRSRAIARDGDDFAPRWDAWAAGEAEHWARERTWERADLVVDGLTGRVS
jgi:uridine kinase